MQFLSIRVLVVCSFYIFINQFITHCVAFNLQFTYYYIIIIANLYFAPQDTAMLIKIDEYFGLQIFFL
jgi:hypothetical protein